MAYYEETVGLALDGTGAGKVAIGPLGQNADQYFLGYLVATTTIGALASYSLQNRQGWPLGGAQGITAVIGPVYLTPNENKQLVVSAGPANGQVQAILVGDVNPDPNNLVVRPSPTGGGATILAAPNRWNASGQALSVAVAGTSLDLTAVNASGSFAVLLYNPGPNRVQVQSSGAAGVDVQFETLYQDDSLRITVPLKLTLLAPDGVQTIDVLTLLY